MVFVNTFEKSSILDAHTFNIIVNPTDIENTYYWTYAACWENADIVIVRWVTQLIINEVY